MSVILSPLGGAGAQFLNNNGVILSGGKLFTYAAGADTLQSTYTTVSGITPHTNPIILDSSGRVPGGEIWFTSTLSYKVVVKDASNVLIGTYDNLTGADASFIPFVGFDGQTGTVSDLAGDDGADWIGFQPSGGTARSVQSKLRDTVSVKDFGAVGNGIADDTQAFANAISYLDSVGGGALYIPDGIYMIDSLTMTGRSKALLGETMGSPTLTHGVILRCRTACSDFVTISGVGHRIESMFIDGNGLAANAVVRYTNNMTDVVTSNVIISGGVSGGILLALAASPQNNNAQISELQFYGVLLAGDTGVTNLYINSDQALVIAFYNLKSFSGDYGIDLVRGTVSLYCPFFTANLVNDIRAVRGRVTVFDGRSESSTINSLSFTGSTNFELNSYVHGATISQTTLELLAGWTGVGTVVGGQYTNILNASPTGTLVLVNQTLYSGGAFYGAYAYKSVDISGGYVKAAKTLSYVNVLTYGTTVSPDMDVADRQYVAATNGTAFAIAAPANPSSYQTMYLTISNQSGGALGAITWNAIYKLAAFTSPATGFQRTISFTYDGAHWIEDFCSPGDVPN